MNFKSFLRSLLCMVACSAVWVGCSDDDNVTPPTPQVPDPVLSVNPLTVEVTAEGGEFTLNFEVKHPTSAGVEAFAEGEWIKDVTVGESAQKEDVLSGVITLAVEPNMEEKAREGVVKVSYPGAAEVSVAVKQEPQIPDPVLSVDPLTVEVTAEGGEFTLNFEVKHPVSAEVKAVAEGEWIKNVTVGEPAQKEDVLSGVITFAVEANLEEKAREGVIKVAYPGVEEVSVAVKQAGLKGPEFTIRSASGNSQGEHTSLYVTFFMTAPHATDFRYIALPSAEVDANVEAGFSLSEIMYCLSKKLTEQEMPLLESLQSGKETALTLLVRQTGVAVAFVAQVQEADGSRRTIRHDIVSGDPQGKELGNEIDTVDADKGDATAAPTLAIDGWVGDENHEYGRTRLTFVVKSDVAKRIRYALLSTANLNEYLEQIDMERIMTDFGQLQPPKMIKERINTPEGLQIPCVELTPGTAYTFLVEAENGAGKVLERKELTTEEGGENLGPKVTVKSWRGDADGNDKDIKVTFHVQSSEAVSMKYLASKTTEVENILNQMGLPIDMLVDMMGKVMDEERLAQLRSPEGLHLVFGGPNFPITSDQTFLYTARNEGGDLTVGRADQPVNAE